MLTSDSSGKRVDTFEGVVYGLKCHCHPEQGYRYVGVSRNLKSRMSDHRGQARSGNKRPVYKWMRKHGVQNIDPEVLSWHETPSEMFEAEIRQIRILKGQGARLLNVTTGGEGTLGYRHPDEVYSRLAESRKRENLSTETRLKLSESSKRENLSPETRKRMSESHKGKTPAAKLTVEQVKDIWEECKVNPSNIQIANRYGLGRHTIANIRRGRSWTHITGFTR